MDRMEAIFLFNVVLFVVGICLLAAGVLVSLRRLAFLARAISIDGTVVELLSRRRSNQYLVKKTDTGLAVEPKRLHRPVVRFTAPDGRRIELTAPVSSSRTLYAVGDTVRVRFDPADPDSAQIDHPLYHWFAPGMLIFFGFFGIGMGLLGIILNRTFPTA